jgi:hypothetical protein
MPNQIQILRSSTAGARPAGKQPGEPYVNFADNQFGVWNAAAADLLAVRFWSTFANYVIGDHVVSAGNLYRAIAINTNSPPPSANWALVGAGTGVDSFNTRTGAVTLTAGDVTAVLPAATNPPLMNGAAAVGVANAWSREDHVHPSDTSRLALAGGTMTGQIVTVAPVAPGDAANKNYVDTLVGNLQLFLGTWQVAANTPSITAGAVNAGDYYIAVTAVPSVPETAPAGVPGIGGTTVANGDLVLWNGTIWQTVIGSGLTKAEADTFYVGLGGGTMTGALMLNATPPVSDNSLRAATTAYVDTAIIDAGVY